MTEDLYAQICERPTWDEYYVTMAFVVAQRSIDPNTRCGCVLVSKDNRILSTGYNGPIKGSNDEEIPMTRPEKYFHFIHAEENALLAYSGSAQDIIGGTAYITGRPCHRCLRDLLQKGITRIVYSCVNVTKVVDQDDMDAQEIMLGHHPEVELVELNDEDDIFDVLHRTEEYIRMKMQQSKNY